MTIDVALLPMVDKRMRKNQVISVMVSEMKIGAERKSINGMFQR